MVLNNKIQQVAEIISIAKNQFSFDGEVTLCINKKEIKCFLSLVEDEYFNYKKATVVLKLLNNPLNVRLSNKKNDVIEPNNAFHSINNYNISGKVIAIIESIRYNELVVSCKSLKIVIRNDKNNKIQCGEYIETFGRLDVQIIKNDEK